MINSSSNRIRKGIAGIEKLKINLFGKGDTLQDSHNNEIDIIKSSEYFDPDWYLVTYPDVANAGLDPAVHYLLYGGLEGRDPGPHFSSSAYLSSHKGKISGAVNPLVHFLETDGQLPIISKMSEADRAEIEYIRKSEYFDELWYKNSYGNKIKSDLDAATHYYLYGSAEKLDPSPRFSTEAYLRSYASVAAGGLNALAHYEKYGRDANLTIEPARDKSAFTQIERFYRETRGLQVFEITNVDQTINLVTDSISSGSLFGGVGTALIFGALLAQKLQRHLRVQAV